MRLSHRVRFMRDHRWAPERMSEYLDGELPPGARARMERHARECPECERVLAGLRALVRGLGELPGLAEGPQGARVAAAVRSRLKDTAAS